MGFLGPTDNASSTTLFIEVSIPLGKVKKKPVAFYLQFLYTP